MSVPETWPLIALLGLGAVHGLNPAMGWLFAVALGMQERSGSAVWRALPPLALGHALSVAVVVALAALAGAVLSGTVLRCAIAAVLIGFGMHRLLRGGRHPRYGGMRVTARDLVMWSFLMASAHGAGLMVLPFVAGGAPAGGHAGHAHHAQTLAAAAPHADTAADALLASIVSGQLAGLVASLLHALSYLAVTGVLAIVVYERAGVRLLRTAWINLDVIWAAALILTGAVLIVQVL